MPNLCPTWALQCLTSNVGASCGDPTHPLCQAESSWAMSAMSFGYPERLKVYPAILFLHPFLGPGSMIAGPSLPCWAFCRWLRTVTCGLATHTYIYIYILYTRFGHIFNSTLHISPLYRSKLKICEWAPYFLSPEWCFSFPWGHFSRIGFFLSPWCFSVPVSVSGAQEFVFFVPGIGLGATRIGFLVPLGTFGARKGFSCARLKWNVLGCFWFPFRLAISIS